jgi:hypothetical protein
MAGPDDHRLYYSTIANHEDFLSPGAGSLNVAGDYQTIMSLMSFNGLLIVWAYPKGVYLVDTRTVDTLQWRINRLSGSYGGVSPLGQCMIENDLLFLDSSGDLQLLSAIQEFSNLGGQSLSKAAKIDDIIRDYADSYGLFAARMVYYARKREVHIALRKKGSSVQNVRLVIDFNNEARPRFRISERDVCQSLWVATQRTPPLSQMRLLAGDNAGLIWILDEDSRAKSGVGYDSRFQTMWTDLSYADPALATKEKNAQFLELSINPTGRYPAVLTVWWDGHIENQETVDLGDLSGLYLGNWILGTSALGDDSIVLKKRIRLTGGGRRISLEVSNSNAGQNFSIAQAWLSFTTGAERTR